VRDRNGTLTLEEPEFEATLLTIDLLPREQMNAIVFDSTNVTQQM
jgi:hypothetical protein